LIEFGRISRIELNGMRPERIPVILGGLPILLGLFEELGIRSLEKVDAGLRMGVLWDLHMRDSQKDRRNQSIKEFIRRFGVDEARANKAAANSLALFTQLKYDNQQLDKLLEWSARLHEIGIAVSHTGFHKHGAYLVEHADLPGFTTTEQQIMSTLIMAHKGNLRKVADTLANLDFAKTVVAIRLGVIFMHAKLNPTTEKIVLKVKARIELEISKKTMAAHPTLSYWLSKEQSMWEEIGAQFNIRELS
jgi:exopolyphosphatase/guanosine-5'-triphosphate,3'-diphosphate pyrophosphatase